MEESNNNTNIHDCDQFQFLMRASHDRDDDGFLQ
jgi:hypothetical protein